ncbi:chitinase [Streptomyces sp. NPDC053542]|uniref:chitinase n=1 Tax=Streptomyces sp. NPDC053542 TaxID=3365710 RepID=UPI0037D94B0B
MTARLTLALGVAALLAWLIPAHLGNGRDGRAASAQPSFAPYALTSIDSTSDVLRAATKIGVKQFNLGFVISDGGRCGPEWGGDEQLRSRAVAQRIDDLRAGGGDVRVSFGGQAGTELARACPSVAALEKAYAKVVDAYGLTKADFDLEGPAVADTGVNARRAQAVARLQKTHPDLDVSLTLAVEPQGMAQKEVRLLTDARKRGVDISAVNILAMHYGDSYNGDMGKYAVQAATAAQRQIKKALAIEDDATAWRTLAVTPMVGVNDVKTEVFTVEDAKQLKRFADRKGLAWLSMWSTDRDQQCAEGATTKPHSTCSGILQDELAFTRVFAPESDANSSSAPAFH